MKLLPADFISNMRQQIGESEAERLFEALDGPSPVSIRINGAKWHGGEWGAPIAWSEYGRYLDYRPQFTTDIPFAAGAYYVQEAGSQFISHILKTEGIEGGKILDMCAAPGGKSTLYSSAVGSRGLVVANEYVRIKRTRSANLALSYFDYGDIPTLPDYKNPLEFLENAVS